MVGTVSFFERDDWAMYKPDCVCADEAPGVRLIAGVLSDGRTNYYVQCLTSGKRGSAVARNKLTDAEREEADRFKVNLEQSREATTRMYAEMARERRETDEQKRVDWWAAYDEYLNSAEWAGRRKAVLERDAYVCQACRQRRAVHVHHTTYRHVFREPLFDLVAVCVRCHDEITAIDREGIPKEYREAS